MKKKVCTCLRGQSIQYGYGDIIIIFPVNTDLLGISYLHVNTSFSIYDKMTQSVANYKDHARGNYNRLSQHMPVIDPVDLHRDTVPVLKWRELFNPLFNSARVIQFWHAWQCCSQIIPA